jgi:hypothetical protein
MSSSSGHILLRRSSRRRRRRRRRDCALVGDHPLERVPREIARRSDVVGIYPDDAALLRLASGLTRSDMHAHRLLAGVLAPAAIAGALAFTAASARATVRPRPERERRRHGGRARLDGRAAPAAHRVHPKVHPTAGRRADNRLDAELSCPPKSDS